MNFAGRIAASPAPLIPNADLSLIDHVDWGFPSHEILACLIDEIPWRQENISLFGKTHMQPRLICWMGNPGCSYTYSGKRYEPVAWHPLVTQLHDRTEALAQAPFNSVLLNLYRDGADSMGFHADDEPELGEHPVIASLSFGADRVIHFRHRHDRSVSTQRIALPDSSLLVMRGDCQTNWKHSIPKTRKAVGPRINLTFRQIIG